MLVYGNKINGTLKAATATLSLGQDVMTKPGDILQIELRTQEGFDPDLEQDAITQVLVLEKQFPDLQVLYVETCNCGKITLQVMDKGPGQISGFALLNALPMILVLIGIVVVGYLLWQVSSGPNAWVLPVLLVVGGAVVFFFLVAPSATKSLGLTGPIVTRGISDRKEGYTARLQTATALQEQAYKEKVSVEKLYNEYTSQANAAQQKADAASTQKTKDKWQQIASHNKDQADALKNRLDAADTKLQKATDDLKRVK